MSWTVEFHDKAREEFMSMPHSIRAKFIGLFENVKLDGFNTLPPKSIKNVDDGIMEFRVRSKDGIARSLFAIATGREVDILLVFVKKTEKTPSRYIELAKKRRSELQNESNNTVRRSNS